MSTPPLSGEADRARISNQVREAAIASVKGFALGEGLLAQIIARATDDLAGSPWSRRSLAERLQIAENIAGQYVASTATKPINLPSATPEELAAKRLALGMTANIGWPGQHLSARDNGGLGGNNSGKYSLIKDSGAGTGFADTSTGAGSGYSWLTHANQNIPGFSRAEVAGAANFLRGAGLSREDVNHDTREMVHLKDHQTEIAELIRMRKDIEARRARGDDVSAAIAAYEAKRGQVRDSLKPGQAPHFDNMNAIRGYVAKQLDAKGDPVVNDKATVVEAPNKLGIRGQLDAQRRATATAMLNDPRGQKAEDDLAAWDVAAASPPPKPDDAKTKVVQENKPGEVKPDAKKDSEGDKGGDKPKPPEKRQALNGKGAAAPSVG